MNPYQITFDPHIHSIASGHGSFDTVTAIAKAASIKGLQMIGITEHGPAIPGACKSSYFRGLLLAPRQRFGVNICYGAEANILDEVGTLDLGNDVLKQLDYTIASLHTKCLRPGSLAYNTAAYVEAMKNPYVHIIGHPDDVAFPVDYDKLVSEAVNHHVLLEINNASLSPNGYRGDVRQNVLALLMYCKKYKHPVILSSDSHGKGHVGDVQYALSVLEACDFPAELVLNGNPEKFRAFIAKY